MSCLWAQHWLMVPESILGSFQRDPTKDSNVWQEFGKTLWQDQGILQIL